MEIRSELDDRTAFYSQRIGTLVITAEAGMDGGDADCNFSIDGGLE